MPSTKRPPGRPPAGKDGLAVSTAYVQTTLRLEPETKDLLDVLTRLLGKPQRQVTGEALALYAGASNCQIESSCTDCSAGGASALHRAD